MVAKGGVLGRDGLVEDRLVRRSGSLLFARRLGLRVRYDRTEAGRGSFLDFLRDFYRVAIILVGSGEVSASLVHARFRRSRGGRFRSGFLNLLHGFRRARYHGVFHGRGFCETFVTLRFIADFLTIPEVDEVLGHLRLAYLAVARSGNLVTRGVIVVFRPFLEIDDVAACRLVRFGRKVVALLQFFRVDRSSDGSVGGS